MLKRESTVSFNLPVPDEGKRIPYESVARAVNDAFGIPDIGCLQPNGNGSYLLTFKKASLAARAQEQGLLFNSVKLPITPVEIGTTTMWLMDLPFEVTHENLRTALTKYGEVKYVDYVYNKKELGGYPNGDRKVNIVMKTLVPNFLRVAGFQVRVKYAGLIQTCRRCGDAGHFAAKCQMGRKCATCGNVWHKSEDCPENKEKEVILREEVNREVEKDETALEEDVEDGRLVIASEPENPASEDGPAVFRKSSLTQRSPAVTSPTGGNEVMELFFTPPKQDNRTLTSQNTSEGMETAAARSNQNLFGEGSMQGQGPMKRKEMGNKMRSSPGSESSEDEGGSSRPNKSRKGKRNKNGKKN